MALILKSTFPRGIAPIHAYGALDDYDAPIVLLFMDAFGPRPALDRIAERLVSEGYRVLLPDLFYEHLPYTPLNPQSVFSDGEDRQRLSAMFGAINQSKIDADIQALLTFCKKQFGRSVPLGVIGYGMGGRYALSAATLSERVVYAAAFHGVNLAPESDDGPHRHFAGIKSRIYVGVAPIDSTFDAAEEARLATALREASVNHVIETYAGAANGLVVDDLPIANAVAANLHWRRLSTQLGDSFSHFTQETRESFWSNF